MASKDETAVWSVRMPKAWPVAPAEVSVSTHAEIDECPRRWALSAADYPDLWGGRGYPQRLQLAALEGSVIHLALEVLTKELTGASVPAMDDPRAPEVLMALGGYTRVVEKCVERILKRFADNPRAVPVLEHAQRTLRGKIPALRARVQTMLARIRLPSGAHPAPGASTPAVAASSATTAAAQTRTALPIGAHPEVDLRAKRIGWKGTADLLVLSDAACEITDFKTGAADDAHRFQVRVYAVLWRLDEERNPAGRMADRLVLAYANHDEMVEAPSAQEIEQMASDLLGRRQAAETALAARPPPARPGEGTCRYCNVRQLCDAYWAGTTQAVSGDRRFGDVELKITGRHGPTSWDTVVVRARELPTHTPALLRLPNAVEFKVGTRVRVLDGALARDPEDSDAPAIVTIGGFSETYRVD